MRPLNNRFALALILLAVTILASSQAAPAQSWSSFRGPAGTGQAADTLPPGDGPLALELAWQRPLGSGYAGVSIAGDKLVTTMAAGERDVVIALSAETGDELWRYDLAPTYPGHDGSHDGPISTPAIADGRVFVLGPWGHLAGLDLETGEELWIAHLAEDLGCEVPYYGFGGSPVAAGENVLLQVGGDTGALVALDAVSGKVSWRAFDGAGDPGSQSPIIAELAGRLQALVLGGHQVAGFDPGDGSLLWELALEGSGPMGSMTQSPMPIDGHRLLVKNQDGEATVVLVQQGADGLEASVVNAGRGLARSYSPPAVSGDHLFGYSARFLSALDPDSGELLWRSRDPGDGFLLSVGSQLAVLTKTGGLYLGPANAESWQQSAHLQLFDDLAWTPPSYADGALFARSLGELARVNLVRSETALAIQAEEIALPAPLAALSADLAHATDRHSAVERFLDGRELPLVDGQSVLFLWHGAAEDVAIGGDMIGMRREEPMQRLAGTDLWWWATELDHRARISYVFFVDDAPTTDPTHGRHAASAVLGPDMNWFRGEGIEMSWFAMPEWPGLSVAERAGATGGRLETVTLSLQPPTPEGAEAPPSIDVPVHVWLPPGYDQSEDRYPTVYLHHPAARVAGAWPETLDRVVGQSVAPLIAVFPEAPRMRGWDDIFADQLVPEIDARYRTLAQRESRANVGMGWPGFSASMMTFDHPETFGLLGVQSLFLLEDPMSSLVEAVGEADATTLPMKIYLEWGRWDLISPHEEMNMRRSSRWAFDFFSERGWKPVGGEVWDSTDFASWRHRTDVLLEALFPLEGAETSLDHWLTGN